MLKLLVKKQLMEIFKAYFYDAKKNKGRSKVKIIIMFLLFIVLMVGIMGGIFGYVADQLCKPLVMVDMKWFYFALMGLLSLLLGVFGSVFNTYAGLYLSKDNDQLLSLPIPEKYIIISRLIAVYCMALLYSASVFVPAIVVYFMTVPFDGLALFGSILMMILISMISMVMSCLLGWLVAKISLKVKNKSFITVVVTLVLIAAYYYVYFKVINSMQEFLKNVAIYGTSIKKNVYGLYMFGMVGSGDIKAMLLCTTIVALASILTWYILKQSFISMATTSGSVKKVEYKEKRTKEASVTSALLRKEFQKFTSSANYMLNCGLGIIVFPIIIVTMLIKGTDFSKAIAGAFTGKTGLIQLIIFVVLCLTMSMINTGAPSVSLEGKSIWILQSLPVSPWTVLKQKMKVELLLIAVPLTATIPVLLFYFQTKNIGLLIGFVLATYSFMMFRVLWDMFWGVKLANINWTNETAPVKQGAAALISVFSGMGISAAAILIFVVVGNEAMSVETYFYAIIGILIFLNILLYIWLRRRGAEAFARL